eukprot:scaffold434031_cov41-Prasinocladus_malaysianus.AAC.1
MPCNRRRTNDFKLQHNFVMNMVYVVPAGTPSSTETQEPACELVTDVLREVDFLSSTYHAIQSAGLLGALGSPAPYVTLLAPTNQARLPMQTWRMFASRSRALHSYFVIKISIENSAVSSI